MSIWVLVEILIFAPMASIDLIAVISTRKAKSRAQLTPTSPYSRTKHVFMLSRGILRMHCSVGIHLLQRIPRVNHTKK
jgi:hypothetical protein